ncbi:MAG TPA: hypothetical protein VGQ59_02205, partial [Cyclobacteriaceae bacterium]|nr:hypothetical protein [Cyclobacteriaceae bacterium]
DSNNNPISVSAYNKTVTRGIRVSSFLRYYLPISNSFYFVAHGEISFNRANTTNTNFNAGGPLNQEVTDENPSYTLSAAIKPVFIFFPSPKWGIEAGVGSLGYNYQRFLPNVASSSSASLSFGGFSFGLAYYFAKK